MPDTIEYLNQLSDERAALAQNLITKGVEVDTSATFTELAPKVLEVPGGGEGKDYSSTLDGSGLKIASSSSAYKFIPILPSMITKATLTGKLPDEITTVSSDKGGFSMTDRYISGSGTQQITRCPLKELNFINFDFNNLDSDSFRRLITGLSSYLQYINIKNCSAPNVTSLDFAFRYSGSAAGSTVLKEVNMSLQLPERNISFSNCFGSNTQLKKVDLRGTNCITNNTTSMFSGLAGCPSLEYIDISGIKHTRENYSSMFGSSIPTTAVIYVHPDDIDWYKDTFYTQRDCFRTH